MFSSTLKRSVGTLAIVAGLLAAAVPASAQGGGAAVTMGGGKDRGSFTVDMATETLAAAGGYGDRAIFTRLEDRPQRGLILNGTGDGQMVTDTQQGQDAQTSRTSSLENTMVSGYNVKAPAVVVLIGANDYGFAERATPAGPSSQKASSQRDDHVDGNAPTATEELFGNYNFLVDATGTQVGSEGITLAHEGFEIQAIGSRSGGEVISSDAY